MKHAITSTLSLACAVAITACGEEITSEGPGSGSQGSGTGSGSGSGMGNGVTQGANFGPCSWSSTGLIAAMGDSAVVNEEEAVPGDEATRLVRLGNDIPEAIAFRTASTVWSSTGGSFTLTCGTDFGVFGTTTEAGGIVCVEASQATIETTPSGDGVWQGVLATELSALFVSSAQRDEGSTTFTFTARSTPGGRVAVCE
jgi:hypothetical protein